jgi:hypothetical protein
MYGNGGKDTKVPVTDNSGVFVKTTERWFVITFTEILLVNNQMT